MSNVSELWECPDCGYEFATANIWHSCGKYGFERHFDGKDPIVTVLFETFREMVESCGEVICYPQKTRIVFQSRIRFAHCQTRKSHLAIGLILPDEFPDFEQLSKIEAYGQQSFGHYFRMEIVEDFDERFGDLVRIAFEAGS